MKTGRSGPSLQDYEVQLPQEIITAILTWISAVSQEQVRRRTLWSCCLLSKAWYSAAIVRLYESPRLSNWNFEHFARTICPPVNSHVRHVGLESFICHLDMGNLAYESTKSVTARLLRRTRASLQTFVAPAVSFSVISLAPLSKCRNLVSLDLSRDHYDIDLEQLLHSIRGLSELRSISLHKGAMRKRCHLKPASCGETSWPIKLASLQINDLLPQRMDQWAEFVGSWPPTLTSVAFEGCLSWNPFYHLHEANVIAEYVTTLRIGMRREEDGFPIEILLVEFPRLLSLAIPTPVTIPEFATTVSGLSGAGKDLKHLTFRAAPDSVQPKPKVTTRFLSKCVEIHPKLIKIEVPEICLEIDEESLGDVDNMEQLMAVRAGDTQVDTGVYMTN